MGMVPNSYYIGTFMYLIIARFLTHFFLLHSSLQLIGTKVIKCTTVLNDEKSEEGTKAMKFKQNSQNIRLIAL